MMWCVLICAAGTSSEHGCDTSEMLAARKHGGLRCAGNFIAKFRRKLTHDRNVDPDLLKDTALHDRHRTAATARSLPVAAVEPRTRPARGIGGEFVLDHFEFGANAGA